MNRLLWLPEYPTFQPEWDLHVEDIQNTFFKCISWQMEETLDATNCPYHYVCDRTYPPNFPLAVDVLVLLFTSASYLVTLFIVVMDMMSSGRRRSERIRSSSSSSPNRYLLPSGPISLPIIILAFAKGSQINTIFPLSFMGPPILQLVLISALSFDYGADDKDIKYTFFAASTVSGILHASLYLDSIVLPYYTGFDALVSSTFSGECGTCVCRKEALVVGGKLVKYRGWSVTTFLVVGVLCLRILCRIMCGSESEGENGKLLLLKGLTERLSWISIAIDCVYLTAKSPTDRGLLRGAAFGGILLLICLHVLKEACTHIYAMASMAENMKWKIPKFTFWACAKANKTGKIMNPVSIRVSDYSSSNNGVRVTCARAISAQLKPTFQGCLSM
ncbi:putative transmembrane protein [Senna tora]|uniref:Putative transmembrane protein n=1 Tax=Senna tora TaxID=362788 RepID=A0A834W3L5_9FABA|nr:putative transmembrane protein [Senna tora]